MAVALDATGRDAVSRPAEFDDLLSRSSFGAVELAADGRVLVEVRRPDDAGKRFDYGDRDVMFLNRLKVADNRAHGRLRPLFHQATDAGYALGPVSPDGRFAAVYRLARDRFELGIVDVAAGRARWLGVTPEAPYLTRSLQWTASNELIAIVLSPAGAASADAQPYDLRAVRPQWRLPPLWAATARGEASVTAAGSGRYINEHPAGPAKAIMRISALTGRRAILTRGEAVDLEISASGSRVAVLVAAEPVPLEASHKVQGVYGLAVRRTRLLLIDLKTGRRTAPCPRCDVLTGLLAWAPGKDALLAYVRDDGAPWTAGRLLRVDGESGRAIAVPTDVAPTLAWRPERVAAAWLEGDPILFGRRPGETRDNWFRLSDSGPVCLTADLPHASRIGLAVAGRWLVAASGGAAWRIDASGRASRLTSQPFRPYLAQFDGVPARTVYAISYGDGLAGVAGEGLGARAGVLTPDGELRHAEGVPSTSVLAALGDRGAATIAGSKAEPQILSWRPTAGTPNALATINRQLAHVAWPSPIPVDQLTSDGSVRRHWVLLPGDATPERPAPLVVVPYPGSVYRTAPDIVESGVMWPALALVGAGYAVLMPSLPTTKDGRGPGEGLAERVLSAVDAAGAAPAIRDRIDVTRLGAWGHSFGGFAAVTLLTQSDRFGAAVSVEGRLDLISSWGQFSVARRMNPDDGPSTYYSAGWTEDLQGDMAAPPWAATARYVANSPIFAADKVHRPLMLVAGDMDGSHVGQAEEMFAALYRQNKDAILLTYWGEEHSFSSPGNLRDLYRRGIAFLDTYLRPERIKRADFAAHAPHPESVSASSVPRTRPQPPGPAPVRRPAA